MTRTSGISALSASTNSAISRSMRSRVAPSSSRSSRRGRAPRSARAAARTTWGHSGGAARRPLRLRAQPADRFQHRHVGFRGAELLETLAAGDREGPALRRAGDEVLDERRLARAGLARDEDDLSLAFERSAEALGEQIWSSRFRPTSAAAASVAELGGQASRERVPDGRGDRRVPLELRPGCTDGESSRRSDSRGGGRSR